MEFRKQKRKTSKAKVHKDLKGLDIKIDEFGQIISNTEIEKINHFLDKNVADYRFERENKYSPKEEFKIQEPEEIDEAESLKDIIPEEEMLKKPSTKKKDK
ncbi:MAG: hypothetical protein NTX03_01510 [Bacteroidetes bacterium]|nr:hypothetical protein [Bacteroidota bacterium]